jgi:hypothetical protein
VTLVCQICGPVKLVEGRRLDVTSDNWTSFGAHVEVHHPEAMQVSVRIEE